jgi:hypothetical protein
MSTQGSRGNSRPALGGGDYRKAGKPTVDGDGWATVNKPAKQGSRSGDKQQKTSPKSSNVAGGFAALSVNNGGAKVKAMTAEEAGKVGVSALKEFYTSGDIKEAQERWVEAIGNDLARGTAVVSKALEFVLNDGKEAEAEKYVQVALSVHSAGSLTGPMLAAGFLEGLDFLYDIAIDAPLAPAHAKNIVLSCVEAVGDLDVSFLAGAGENLRYDGNAVKFAELVGAGEDIIAKVR